MIGVHSYFRCISTYCIVNAKGIQMQLWQKWKESWVNFFEPKTLQQFLMITLKTIFQTYKVWFTYFGWALFLYLLCDALYPTVHVSGFVFLNAESLSWSMAAWLRFIGWYALLFTLYLSCRPSVMPKGFIYTIGYFKHYVQFLLGILFFSWIDYILVFTLGFGGPVHMYDLGMSFIVIFSVLFFINGPAQLQYLIRSYIKGFTMLWYNAPLCVVFGISFMLIFRTLCAAIVMLLSFLIALKLGNYPILFAEWFERAFYMLLMPIPVSFIVNIYTKKIYEDFALYFPTDVVEEGV